MNSLYRVSNASLFSLKIFIRKKLFIQESIVEKFHFQETNKINGCFISWLDKKTRYVFLKVFSKRKVKSSSLLFDTIAIQMISLCYKRFSAVFTNMYKHKV